MDEKKSRESTTPVSSNLFALECLATTAGQLHESEKLKRNPNQSNTPSPNITTGSIHESDKEEISNKVPVVQMTPMPPEHCSGSLPPMSFGSFYSPFSQPPPTSIRPFTDFSFPPPFNHSPFRNFMDMVPPPAPFGVKIEDMPWNRPVLPSMISSHENPDNNNPNLSSDTAKSAFDIVPKRHIGSTSPHSSNNYDMNHSAYPTQDNIPQQPPMLFRIDQPNNSSLLETLVQESQKILSSQEENENKGKSIADSGCPELKNEKTDQASKTNDDFKRAREMVLISPQKKTVRKQRNGLHSVNDVKRAYGGPPFKPGYPPPSLNTPESVTCCIYEHTLLKMATRGFWSGDRGPLQDVFRLSRVENSDLQYNMKAITKHCYNVVKRKLDHAEGDKEMMHKHMRNYVDEFDNYLERIYPVSSIAINLYLPTAADYGVATWHGIVPTGWSEYRRAVVIREVFEVLYHLSSTCSDSSLPEYTSKYFDRPSPDHSLYPIPFEGSKNKIYNPEDDNQGSVNKDPNNNGNEAVDTSKCSSSNTKFSRAFEALWTRSSPHEPFLILHDSVQLKLREYLEKYPIEVYAPMEVALIVVDEKKYKARNILGFFRRGVQLVDYSKESGSMVIDTISTIRNVSATSAVRKIPPGRISKLVHPDLHLENYTNAILQVGNNGLQDDSVQGVNVKPPKIRRRRGKNRNTSSGDVKEEKVKKRRTKQHRSNTPTIAHDPFLSPPPLPPVDKLDSIESICNSMKMEGVEDKLFPNASQHVPNFPRLTSSNNGNEKHMSMDAASPTQSNNNSAHPDTNHSVESMLPKDSSSLSNNQPISRPYLVNQYTQTLYDSLLSTKQDTTPTSLFSPDILSPMYLQQQDKNQQPSLGVGVGACPPGYPDQQSFSLHLMIDSYRRAAKYLLDTANHLELVARHGNHGNTAPSNSNNVGTKSENEVLKKETHDE